MTQLQIDRVSKQIGKLEILRSVSLDLYPGEFVTLVGPSGCGKSTLLRIIAGLEAGYTGRVVIGGKDVCSATPRQRNIAMVFQNYALYPHMTVFENVATPLRMERLSFLERIGLPVSGGRTTAKLRDIGEEVTRVLGSLDIAHLRDRRPSELSGGQKQRVALGRAMIRQPTAFLMDEPLSNLDAQLRVHMRSEIIQLHKRMKATFVYVTHDQAEALTMSDRVAVMRSGEIMQFDTPYEVYNNPAHQYVAEFVGSPKINILSCSVEQDGRVSIGNYVVGQTSKNLSSKRMNLGLRPDAVALIKDGTEHVRGKCTFVENLGDTAYVHVRAAAEFGGPIIVKTGTDDLPEVGTEVNVRFDLRRGFAFDEAGLRLGWEVTQ